MKKNKRLGEFENIVLLALIRLGTNAYGVTIQREITKRTGRDVSAGAVYTTLGRLEKKGFISARLGEATPERGGRAKRYYSIKASGRCAVQDRQEAEKRMRVDLCPFPSRA